MSISSCRIGAALLATSAVVLTISATAFAESGEFVSPPSPISVSAPARASIDHDLDVAGSSSSPRTADESGPRTLFASHGAHAFGGFGGISVGYTRFARTDATEVCGEGAFLFDHALSIGGAGCGIATRIDGQRYGTVVHAPGDRLEFGFGGLALRYHFFATEMVNISLGTIIGGGAATITNSEYEGHYGDRHTKSTDAVFVMEPRIAAFANLTRWARVGVFGGYRFVTGSDTANLSSTNLGGATAGATVHFGWL